MSRSGSVSSGRSSSSRSSKRSRGSTTVSTKSVQVDLPKKSRVMDFVLWTAGAKPSSIHSLRREEVTLEYDDEDDWSRTTTRYYFVGTPQDYSYYDFDDNRSSFSGRSKSRSSSSGRSSGRRSSRRQNQRPKDPVWEKRPTHAHVEMESDDDDDDSSDAGSYYSQHDYPPQNHGPPPMFHHPPPQQFGGPMPPPPPAPAGDQPAFYTLPPQH